jgi:HPt (histidine-containing phosphotransfer) domain-containing protein
VLIYTNDGKLHCISKRALKLAGYGDVAQFHEEHDDFSELFVKKPGYIYNFEHFSWLSFLRNANTDQKKVLIATRDNATYECDLELEILYTVEFSENSPEFYYRIDFKNLHLAGSDASSGLSADFGEFSEENMAATIDLDRELIDREHAAFEGQPEPAQTAATFPDEEEAPAVVFSTPEPEESEEPAPVRFDTETHTEEESEALSFDFAAEEETPFGETAQEAPETPAPQAEEALDLVDFSFEETPAEAEEEKEKEAPLSVDDEALANAFAALETPAEPSREAPEPLSPAPEAPEAAPEPESEEIASVFEETVPESESERAASVFEEAAPGAAPRDTALPDLQKAAAALGLPETMVRAFVKEFIDTYFGDLPEVEMAIRAEQIQVIKTEALKLKGIAGNFLMEPLVQTLEEVLAARRKNDVKAKWAEVDGYMRRLAETYSPEAAERAPTSLGADEAPGPQPTETETETATATTETTETAVESVTLVLEEPGTGETVAFDPNEAADALGLPESLIVEFVNDFIVQAEEEKRNFIDAFAAGDVKKVNETAHKLKGVAANLRIEEMRELMEQAQHSGSLEEAEKPLKAFYKKLPALRNTMAKEFA